MISIFNEKQAGGAAIACRQSGTPASWHPRESEAQVSLFSLSSGPPWNLECTVDELGLDLICHIHGGESHLGAMALSHWDASRVHTRSLVLEDHKEGPIAVHAAHKLCLASHRTVACIAGIHFDAPTSEQIREISDAAHHLAVQAAYRLKTQRYRCALDASGSMYARVTHDTEALAAQIREFLKRPLEALHQEHQHSLQESQREYFDNKILLFAPLYLSNACLNDCAYCGFRRGVRQHRVHLDLARALEEAKILAALGHRTIDLVTGEIPSDAFIRYICSVIRGIRNETPIVRINLNLGALQQQQYEQLIDAGACGYHLYQETYNPEAYFRVHRDGPKRHMEYRLSGLHRAAAAGFRQLGMGVLLGLHDIASDLAALVRHAEILLRDHPQVRIGFSLPRVQSAQGQLVDPFQGGAPDDDFLKSLLFLRLRFPGAHLTLTTRESARLRDLMIPLGITKMSAGVSTAPGGYKARHPAKPGAIMAACATHDECAQFEVHDERSLEDVRRSIVRSGRVPTCLD